MTPDYYFNNEGVRSTETHEKKPENVEPRKKITIDKRNLVIYSEIMKPKFDEGLH